MEKEIESSVALEPVDVETVPDYNPSVPYGVPCDTNKEFDLRFLKSNAFYAIIVGAISFILLDTELATRSWQYIAGTFLSIVSVGFWGTRTIDRVTDKTTK